MNQNKFVEESLELFRLLWAGVDESPFIDIMFGDNEEWKEKIGSFSNRTNDFLAQRTFNLARMLFKDIMAQTYIRCEEKGLNQEKDPIFAHHIDNLFYSVVDDEKYIHLLNSYSAIMYVDRGIFIPFVNKNDLKETYSLSDIKLNEAVEKKIIQINEGDESFARINPYFNCAMPIGADQTCSAPYIVALYNLLSRLVNKVGKVFEIGVGCGYQISNLALMDSDSQVYGIEYEEELLNNAKSNLSKIEDKEKRFNLDERIHIEQGDGFDFSEESFFVKNSPYDLIAVSCMTPYNFDIESLASSSYLNEGGLIIIPQAFEKDKELGYLKIYYKGKNEIKSYNIANVIFVPAKINLDNKFLVQNRKI